MFIATADIWDVAASVWDVTGAMGVCYRRRVGCYSYYEAITGAVRTVKPLWGLLGCYNLYTGCCSLYVGCTCAMWAVTGAVWGVAAVMWAVHPLCGLLQLQPPCGLLQSLCGLQQPLILAPTGKTKNKN